MKPFSRPDCCNTTGYCSNRTDVDDVTEYMDATY